MERDELQSEFGTILDSCGFFALCQTEVVARYISRSIISIPLLLSLCVAFNGASRRCFFTPIDGCEFQAVFLRDKAPQIFRCCSFVGVLEMIFSTAFGRWSESLAPGASIIIKAARAF